jgi:hypothetical protein
MKKKMVPVTWRWPSGYLEKIIVPELILVDIYRALKNSNKIYDLKFDGLDYKHYVQTYGGVVVDTYINPGFLRSPWPYVVTLLVGGGIGTFVLLRSKERKKIKILKQTPSLQSVINRLLQNLPAGSKYWGISETMPTPITQLPTGYRYSSSVGTVTEAGKLWFIIPSGGS